MDRNINFVRIYGEVREILNAKPIFLMCSWEKHINMSLPTDSPPQ